MVTFRSFGRIRLSFQSQLAGYGPPHLRTRDQLSLASEFGADHRLRHLPAVRHLPTTAINIFDDNNTSAQPGTVLSTWPIRLPSPS
jgi:hypothetical protein